MGLIRPQKVKVKWNSANKKRFESLGYVYTKMKDEFEVNVDDLSKGSNIDIFYICDECKNIFNTSYNNFNKKVKEDGTYYCKNCGTLLIAKEKTKKTKLSKSKSFYDWCIENNRQDVLDRWDYDLNDCSPSEISYASNIPKWFKCIIHREHKSELKVISRLTSGNQEGSIECNQCNSIAQYIIDNFPDKKLEEVWDYEKNKDLDPWKISRGYDGKKIWIFCQEGCTKSYNITPNHFTNGARCPDISHRLRGDKHPNWKIDKTQEEREKDRSYEKYAKWRQKVYERDNYTCKCCGNNKGGNLNAHHLNGYNWDKEHRTDIDNGITLCETCHKEFHKLYGQGNNTKEQFKEYLKNILTND